MPHRLELYAHRSNPDLLGLGLLILLVERITVCHYLQNQKFECKLRRRFQKCKTFLKIFHNLLYNTPSFADLIGESPILLPDLAFFSYRMGFF